MYRLRHETKERKRTSSQLSIVALLPVGLVFFATADWERPQRVVRALAFPAVAVLAAFALLYYFEHIIY